MAGEEGWSFDDVPESGLRVALKPLFEFLEPLKGKVRLLLILLGIVVLVLVANGTFFQLEPEEEED